MRQSADTNGAGSRAQRLSRGTYLASKQEVRLLNASSRHQSIGEFSKGSSNGDGRPGVFAHVSCSVAISRSRLEHQPNQCGLQLRIVCWCGRLQVRVKVGTTQSEHLSSGLPLEADIAQCGRHVAKVQHSEVVASFDHLV